MAIPSKNLLGNPNVTEGNFQIAIEQLRESVIGSGKTYDSANTYMAYDTCIYNGLIYYSKINSNTGNTPSVGVNWGLIGDLFNLLITNGTVLGYGTGSGGTVTQLTSKSTAVTLNKPSGTITISNSTLNAGASVVFMLYNSLCLHGDICVITSSNGDYSVTSVVQNGQMYIKLTNTTASSLSDTFVIMYALIKGATI